MILKYEISEVLLIHLPTTIEMNFHGGLKLLLNNNDGELKPPSS